MDALILTMFVSLFLAVTGVALFAWLVRARTFDHADRLALLPLETERSARPPVRGLRGEHSCIERSARPLPSLPSVPATGTPVRGLRGEHSCIERSARPLLPTETLAERKTQP